MIISCYWYFLWVENTTLPHWQNWFNITLIDKISSILSILNENHKIHSTVRNVPLYFCFLYNFEINLRCIRLQRNSNELTDWIVCIACRTHTATILLKISSRTPQSQKQFPLVAFNKLKQNQHTAATQRKEHK